MTTIQKKLVTSFVCGLAMFATFGLLSFSSLEDHLEKLIAGFKKYLDELPQEKVYLHFDRPTYTNGETIWFKAYLTAGEFHKPSQLSRAIYVELLNDDGKLVKQVKLYSIEGSAAGNIALPDSLPSGNYLVRSYTNWMKNGDEDYFFHRPIKIWNTQGQPVSAAPVKEAMDIQFFPEGGDLVNRIQSKVAVKAVGSDGLGKYIKGKIVNETDSVLAEFKTNQFGMGAFSFLPKSGSTYRAIIEHQPDVKLPLAKESGLAMTVSNQPTSSDFSLRIQMTDYKSYGTIYIIAQTRGIVCYAAHSDLKANFMSLKIPKSKFPDGVAQITVADNNGVPLAERLIFIDHGEQLKIKINADKPAYKPREKVTLQINASDNKGLPVAADLSLSVCDDKQVLIDDNRETIASYLLVSSELRGLIESPGYYFNPANKDRAEALNYLLLTQGWRRFSLQKAMTPEWQKAKYRVEEGLTIKGKMVNKFNDKPVADGKVTFVSFGGSLDAKEGHTNSAGDFEIYDVVYFDSVKATLQGETKKGNRAVKLSVDNATFLDNHFPLLPLLSNPTQSEQSLMTQRNETFHNEGKTTMLKEVAVKSTREPTPTRESVYGRGSVYERVVGKPYLENSTHPLQLIQGRVPGISITGGGLHWGVSIRGRGTPLFMVDDIMVDVDMLSSLPVRDIESYSIWKGGDAIFGSLGANGVIAFYTKKGGGSVPQAEGVFPFNAGGFQNEREFYSPKYDVEPTEKKVDKRATLFWAPHVQTDSTGFATISFYNSDSETTATGIIEGISTTGVPGVATIKYEIKKN